MEVHTRFRALNDNVFTQMFVKNGKTFMHVYDEDGNLLDVLEEVASYIPPNEDASKIGNQ